MPFVITDATGRTIPAGSSPTLSNVVGTTAPPPPSPLVISPMNAPPQIGCAGKTLPFTLLGGTPPYSATITLAPVPVPAVTPILNSPVTTAGGTLNVQFPAAPPVPPGTVGTVTILDASSPQQTTSATITCN